MTMTLAMYANHLAAEGSEVTGASIYEAFQTLPGFTQWPEGSPIECGRSESYPAVCAFTFPYAEYQEGGDVITVPGLEAVSAIDYLP